MTVNQRVFITGLSALTASGSTADETWDAILNGQSGIAPIEEYDISEWPAKLGAELKDFNPKKMLPDKKLVKVISKQDVMGINAAMQAIENSNLVEFRDSLEDPTDFNDKTGVYIGSPGNKYYQQYDFLSLIAKSQGDMNVFADELFSEVHPMWLLRILPNNVLAYTGICYGLKGPNHNVTNHATSGLQALIEAYHAINTGQIERAVVVAYDAAVEPQSIFNYGKLGVLSEKELKAFDKNHDGTILGNGAAAIILESESSATKRNAKKFAEINAGKSNSEAAGLFSIEEDGESLSKLISSTLKQANINAKDLSLVVAHANGNPLSDNSESHALKQTINEDTPVTGFKWSYGHTLTASGLLDTVFTCYALQEKQVPGIANFEEAANNSQGLAISHQTQPITKASHAMIINRGFGSMNACLVIKHCE